MKDLLFIIGVLLTLGVGAFVVGIVLRFTQATGDAFLGGASSAGRMVVSRFKAAKEAREHERTKDDQSRRENARASAEFFFQLHSPALGVRFPKAEFDEFIKRYMNDSLLPIFVERKALQLRHLIEDHLDALTPPETRRFGRAREEAREEAARYFWSHIDALRGPYPPELFEAFVRMEMHDDLTPQQCWAACHKLIEQLKPFVAQERERRNEEDRRRRGQESRRRETHREIERLQAYIEQLMSSPLDREIVEAEVMKTRLRVRELEQEREGLHETV